MSFPSDELDAFYWVGREKSFSKAAKMLSISQSAVSQRVARLENRLEMLLFIRNKTSLSLSPFGEELMQYCQLRAKLEDGLLQKVRTPEKQVGLFGAVRIGAFSSISRSVVLKALVPLARENPELQLDIQAAEIRDLPAMLRSGAVDYILMDQKLSRKSVQSLFLGEETNVMVEPKTGNVLQRYLDHDVNDSVTEQFLEIQEKKPPNLSRHYLDDIYGILDGVELGLGLAVVSRHLAVNRPDLKICEEYKPLKVPVWLHFNALEYETPLHRTICQVLEKQVPLLLDQ